MKKLWLKRLAPLAALLCMLVAAVPVFAKNDVFFNFVQISDTHWGSMDSLEVTRKFVEEINQLPMRIAFIVHTGDILSDCIDNPKIVEEGLTIMARLKMPVHYVPGNHDLPTAKITNALELYTRYFGPPCTTADYFGVRCIFWGAAFGVNAAPVSNRGDPLEWLADQVEQSGRHPVLIFQHSPAVQDYYGMQFHPGWPDSILQRWKNILTKGRVQGVFAGHFHRDELHWIGDVPIYVTTPVVRYYSRQPSYRIYEYRNGKIGFRTQYLEKPSKKKKDADTSI